MPPDLAWRWRRTIERAAIRGVEALTRLVVHIVPRARAYGVLVWLSGVIHGATRGLYDRLRRNSPPRDYRTLLLRDMLCSATGAGGIPIRVSLEGAETIERLHAAHGRLILCTAHFGLTLAVFAALEARGLRTAGIGQVSEKRQRFGWGCAGPVNMIESDRLCLVRARLALEAGEVVTVFPERPRSPADLPDTGDPSFDVSLNAFEFAALLGVPILFFGAALGPDGTIRLEVVEPRYSLPGSVVEAEMLAEEFCAFVEARTGRPCRIAPEGKLPPLPRAA